MGNKIFRSCALVVVIFVLALVAYGLFRNPDPGQWPQAHVVWMGIASLVLGALGIVPGLFNRSNGDPPLPSGEQTMAKNASPPCGDTPKSAISVGGSISAGRDVVIGDKITTVHNSHAAPRSQRDRPSSDARSASPGTLKLLFSQRLGSSDWCALADVLEIPLQEQQRFDRGDEARAIWAWLEVRENLNRLPDALGQINRLDLAEALSALE